MNNTFESEAEAIAFLVRRGYTIDSCGIIVCPHTWKDDECVAVRYLCDEWDYMWEAASVYE